MSTQIVHAPSIEARIDSHRYLWNARLETSEAYVHGAKKDGNVDGLEAINPISRSNETANLTHSHIPSNGNALSSPLSPLENRSSSFFHAVSFFSGSRKLPEFLLLPREISAEGKDIKGKVFVCVRGFGPRSVGCNA